ncbi:MAG: hypothetical protein IT324_06270 [Anaerolineae bacterium]|nr:hypothetical protein [Anaerolineae bacterium]
MIRNLDDRMLLLLALAPLILAILVFAAVLGVRTLTAPPPTLTPTITPLPVIVITATFVPPTSPATSPAIPSQPATPSPTPRGSIEIRYPDRPPRFSTEPDTL